MTADPQQRIALNPASADVPQLGGGSTVSADSTPTWHTKDGQVLRIADMTDTHLVNAIRMLRRHRFLTPDEFLSGLACAASFPSDSMAADCAANEMADVKVSRTLEDLIGEAERRGLEHEEP